MNILIQCRWNYLKNYQNYNESKKEPNTVYKPLKRLIY